MKQFVGLAPEIHHCCPIFYFAQLVVQEGCEITSVAIRL